MSVTTKLCQHNPGESQVRNKKGTNSLAAVLFQPDFEKLTLIFFTPIIMKEHSCGNSFKNSSHFSSRLFSWKSHPVTLQRYLKTTNLRAESSASFKAKNKCRKWPVWAKERKKLLVNKSRFYIYSWCQLIYTPSKRSLKQALVVSYCYASSNDEGTRLPFHNFYINWELCVLFIHIFLANLALMESFWNTHVELSKKAKEQGMD